MQALEKAGAKVLIGHHRAHSPIMAKAQAVLQCGQLGRLVAVMGSAAFYKPDSYFTENAWRMQKGGGPILLNMIHEVHNLRMLCGARLGQHQPAFCQRRAGHLHALRHRRRARSWEQTSQENKAYASYPDEDCYVISGTNGSLGVPTMRLKTYARAEAIVQAAASGNTVHLSAR